MDGKKEYNLDIIEMHNKDLILDPRGILMKLYGSLGVTCSDSYLDTRYMALNPELVT